MLLDFSLKIDEFENDVNQTLKFWTDSFNFISHKHCPLVTKRIRKHKQPIWITSEILDLMHRRDHTKSKGNHNEYKQMRNKCKIMVRDSKAKFYRNSIELCKNQPRELVKLFNELGVKDTSRYGINTIIHEEEVIENKKTMVNLFNTYFVNIGDKYTTENLYQGHCFDQTRLNTFIEQRVPIQNQFDIPLINHQFVFKYINEMKGNKATGHDDVSARFIKLTAPYITDSIVKICNCSIRTGSFPDKWKEARVTPIHTKNSREEISNYRPISILPIASKILEKHVSIHLYEYLTSHNLLHERQSGFRPNHSCESALTLMMEEWHASLNSGHQIGLLLIDLCKAFDLVNHKLLIKKLELYKCNTNTVIWFQSYINNRQQTVEIDKIKSNPLQIKSGVPQGSILGPLLFLIFINDIFLEDGLTDIDIFADDAVAVKLQECADSFQGWCLKNYMVLSVEKTKTLYISSRQKVIQNRADNSSTKIILNNIEINEVDSTKLLGIKINNNLSWDGQVAQVKNMCPTDYRSLGK